MDYSWIICELAHLKNLQICYSGISQRICRFADWTKNNASPPYAYKRGAPCLQLSRQKINTPTCAWIERIKYFSTVLSFQRQILSEKFTCMYAKVMVWMKICLSIWFGRRKSSLRFSSEDKSSLWCLYSVFQVWPVLLLFTGSTSWQVIPDLTGSTFPEKLLRIVLF